jgi:hypothetical protein
VLSVPVDRVADERCRAERPTRVLGTVRPDPGSRKSPRSRQTPTGPSRPPAPVGPGGRSRRVRHRPNAAGWRGPGRAEADLGPRTVTVGLTGRQVSPGGRPSGRVRRRCAHDHQRRSRSSAARSRSSAAWLRSSARRSRSSAAIAGVNQLAGHGRQLAHCLELMGPSRPAAGYCTHRGSPPAGPGGGWGRTGPLAH